MSKRQTMARPRGIKLLAVSSDAQAKEDAASLPAQDQALDVLVAQYNAEIVDTIKIDGISRDFWTWEEFTDHAKSLKSDVGAQMKAHWAAQDFEILFVYDSTRYGRKESILLEFAGKTIAAGAIIVHHIGGVLDKSNYEGGASLLAAYASAQEMRTRKERTKMGHAKRFKDGKHYADVPMTHIELYDDKHNPLGVYDLNPLMTPIWRDVKTLVLEGVSWAHIEHELFERFKHVNPATGRPFNRNTFYRLLTQSPMTWGIIARFHSHRAAPKRATHWVHHWLYDPRVPVPDGIEIQPETCPAVFTGQDLLDMQAELRSRADLKGNASAAQAYRFSGLCICDTCHMSMKVKTKYATGTRKKYTYMACNYIYYNCPNRKSVPFDTLQAYIQGVLQDIIQTHTWPDNLGQQDTTGGRWGMLEAEAKQIDTQMDTLINEMSRASAAVREKIHHRLDVLSDRLEAIKKEQHALQQSRQTHVRRQEIMESAIVYLETITLPRLWTLPDREINQFLKRLFDGRRVVIREKDIIGIL